jgi:MFS family permease
MIPKSYVKNNLGLSHWLDHIHRQSWLIHAGETILHPSEKRILTVSCFGHFLSHYNMMAFPVLVIPLTGLLKMELAQVLTLSTWMYALFGLSALLWGPLADRFGAKPMFMVYFLGSGLCGLGAAWYSDSPGMFQLCLAGIGLFSGVHHPVALGMISKKVKKVARGMGYHGMAGNMGLATGPMLTGLINWLAGVQGAYFFLAILNLGGIILLSKMPLASREQEARLEEVTHTTRSSLTPFLIILGCVVLGGISYRAVTVIIPALMELRAGGLFSSLGLDEILSGTVLASTLTSLMYLLGVAAQYTGGRLGERYDQRYLYMLFYLAGVPVALVSYWLIDAPLVVVTALFLFILVGYQPIENALTGALTPAHLRYSAFGVKCAATFGVGALAVWLAGGVQENYGIQAVLPVVGFWESWGGGDLCAHRGDQPQAREAESS